MNYVVHFKKTQIKISILSEIPFCRPPPRVAAQGIPFIQMAGCHVKQICLKLMDLKSRSMNVNITF